jgi:rhodanese-related sulfurtransferase
MKRGNQLLIIIFLFPLFVFSQQVGKPDFDKMLHKLLQFSVKAVSVNELDSLSNIVFLDAREHKEFKVSHIKNAIFVGYNNFQIKSVKAIPKDAKIVVYCSVGFRSEKICEKLKAAGFTNVLNLYGGIFEWKNVGKSVFTSNGKETQNVHAFDKDWGKWLCKGVKVY